MRKVLIFGFLCGALSVFVFHQGTIYLLHHQFALLKTLGVPDAFRPATDGYSFRPVPPLGVPQVLSLAFWGGVWGILLAALLRYTRLPDLLTGLLFGGLVCTLVGFTLVAQARGQPMLSASAITWARVIVINGAWGLGAALLMRPLRVARG